MTLVIQWHNVYYGYLPLPDLNSVNPMTTTPVTGNAVNLMSKKLQLLKYRMAKWRSIGVILTKVFPEKNRQELWARWFDSRQTNSQLLSRFCIWTANSSSILRICYIPELLFSMAGSHSRRRWIPWQHARSPTIIGSAPETIVLTRVIGSGIRLPSAMAPLLPETASLFE